MKENAPHTRRVRIYINSHKVISMTLIELFLIALGLSMDAFAVAVCKGLSVRRARWQDALCVGIYFGVFQAGMPLIGYFLGIRFESLIKEYDHWIAFVLLGLIGANMIREAFGQEDEDESSPSFGPRAMLPLAVATSIDALAVGVSFAFLSVSIVPAVSFIGIVTLTLSAVGLFIGNIFGSKYKKGAELAGGVILILMGTKILLEHLGVIAF